MVLDFQTEKPLARVEGKVVSGNISIAAKSTTRRTGQLSLVFDSTTKNITNVNNLIAVDKKVQISIGITNPYYQSSIDEYNKIRNQVLILAHEMGMDEFDVFDDAMLDALKANTIKVYYERYYNYYRNELIKQHIAVNGEEPTGTALTNIEVQAENQVGTKPTEQAQ